MEFEITSVMPNAKKKNERCNIFILGNSVKKKLRSVGQVSEVQSSPHDNDLNECGVHVIE